CEQTRFDKRLCGAGRVRPVGSPLDRVLADHRTAELPGMRLVVPATGRPRRPHRAVAALGVRGHGPVRRVPARRIRPGPRRTPRVSAHGREFRGERRDQSSAGDRGRVAGPGQGGTESGGRGLRSRVRRAVRHHERLRPRPSPSLGRPPVRRHDRRNAQPGTESDPAGRRPAGRRAVRPVAGGDATALGHRRGPSPAMRETSGPPEAPHPTQGLNDTVHHRTRLGIMTVLHEVDRADFGYLRDTLNLTDGNLSRHLRTLDEAGYIEIHKGYHGRRPRTWLSLPPKGSRALAQELTALRELVARLDGVADSTETAEDK